jgi:hypothetical protein
MDWYCPYCGTPCFVGRIVPDGRWVHMHTCYSGMEADLAKFGQNYLTATHPYGRQVA